LGYFKVDIGQETRGQGQNLFPEVAKRLLFSYLYQDQSTRGEREATPVAGANKKASAPPAARANAPAQYTRLRIVEAAERCVKKGGSNFLTFHGAKRPLFVGTRNTVWCHEKHFNSTHLSRGW